MKIPAEVTINEVGLRDGLQLESSILSVEQKMNIVSFLYKANLKEIEFGAFVHPELVPQMANSRDFFERIHDLYQDLKLVALVPNLKGTQIAQESGVKELNFVISISNTHNFQNVRQSTEQSIESYKQIVEFAQDYGMKIQVTLATTFGCPFEGAISEERVLEVTDALVKVGAQRITFADTTGVANPNQVYKLLGEILKEWPKQEIGLHFHNTRGMGLANILAGLEAGVTIFDSSLGGIGGCPFAPGATGNVCTEDVVHMLENMGVSTSISLDNLLKSSGIFEQYLGHELPSQVLKAGKSSRIYPIPQKII